MEIIPQNDNDIDQSEKRQTLRRAFKHGSKRLRERRPLIEIADDITNAISIND